MRYYSSFGVLLTSVLLLLGSENLVSATTTPRSQAQCSNSLHEQSFDYVIIGGGTAGLVLANRLTEKADITVAVLEAGTHAEDISGNWSQVPAYAAKFMDGAPEMSWNFSTTPQPVSYGKTKLDNWRTVYTNLTRDLTMLRVVILEAKW